MAKIKIKEGSLTIEVFDDDDVEVFSGHFPKDNFTFDETVIEAWKLVPSKAPNSPPTHELAKMKLHGQGKSKISK